MYLNYFITYKLIELSKLQDYNTFLAVGEHLNQQDLVSHHTGVLSISPPLINIKIQMQWGNKNNYQLKSMLIVCVCDVCDCHGVNKALWPHPNNIRTCTCICICIYICIIILLHHCINYIIYMVYYNINMFAENHKELQLWL